MLITVNFDWAESENTAWILPVPSDPEDIQIDIADGAPVFGGTDIIEEAKEDIEDSMRFLFVPYLATTVVPIPPMLYFSISGMMSGTTGVDIHESLEKYGLTAEVVSASHGEGLYQYLNNNGFEIDSGFVSQLDDYVEMDYSFIITWISDLNKTVMNPGIIMEFPTKEMFFPLILTSIYRTDVIPIELMIVGHVTPKLYNEIESFTKIRYFEPAYFKSGYYSSSSEIDNFTNDISRNWDRKFTSIEIDAPSSLFVDDLWIENKVPDKVEYAHTIHQDFGHGYRFMQLYIMFSLIIGFVLGLLIFGIKKEGLVFYVIMGGSNVIGILVLIIFTFISIRFINKKRSEVNKITIEKGILFIFIYVLAFITCMWLTLNALAQPLY